MNERKKNKEENQRNKGNKSEMLIAKHMFRFVESARSSG